MEPNASEKTTFTSNEVCEIIGVSRRQVQHWSNTGLIRPPLRTPGGHARYLFQDLVSFKTAQKLLEAGVSLQRIRRSIRELRRILPTVKRPLSELTLVATGEVVLVFYEGTVFEAISGQEWIVEVAEVQRSVDKWTRRLEELRRVRKIHKGRNPRNIAGKAS